MSQEKSFSPYTQIQEQFGSGHRSATVLVERSNGTISTGQYTGEIDSDGNAKVYVEMSPTDHRVGEKQMLPTALTDVWQEKLANSLGNTAVGHRIDATEILPEENESNLALDSSIASDLSDERPKTKDQLLDELTAGLTENDKTNLFGYARALSNKKADQMAGNGQGSISNGQLAGSYYKSLSPHAQDIAPRFVSLLD